VLGATVDLHAQAISEQGEPRRKKGKTSGCQAIALMDSFPNPLLSVQRARCPFPYCTFLVHACMAQQSKKKRTLNVVQRKTSTIKHSLC